MVRTYRRNAGTIESASGRFAGSASARCGSPVRASGGRRADHDGAIAVLRRAVELGVNLIDTADSYGPHVSEELIAEALHPYPEDLLIATKGGMIRTGPGPAGRADGRPEHLREACEGSLRRLRLDTIELYQQHRPDPKVPYERSIGALKELQDEGKIRHIGVSNVSVDQLETAREIVEVVSVQNRFNLTDRSLPGCARAVRGARDRLLPVGADRDGRARRAGRPAGPDRVAHTTRRRGRLRSPGCWRARAAIVPIPGTSSVEHLEENLGAAEVQLTAGRARRARVGRRLGNEKAGPSEPGLSRLYRGSCKCLSRPSPFSDGLGRRSGLNGSVPGTRLTPENPRSVRVHVGELHGEVADAVRAGERCELHRAEHADRSAGRVHESAAGVTRDPGRDRVDVVAPAAGSALDDESLLRA